MNEQEEAEDYTRQEQVKQLKSMDAHLENLQSQTEVNLAGARMTDAHARVHVARITVRHRLSGCIVALTVFAIAGGIWAMVRFG